LKPTTDIDTNHELEKEILAFIAGGAGDFGELMLRAHAFQRLRNEPYGRFCATLPAPSEWREIPAVPQEAFKFSALRSFPETRTTRTFLTSGTSGQGHGAHHLPDLGLYRASALEGWRQAGLPSDNMAFLIAHPDDSPHSSLGQMASWLGPRERFFFSGGMPRWDELEFFLKAEGDAGRPVTLFGTAIAFLDWFTALGDRRLPLPPGSAAIETGGYKGTGREIPKSELYGMFAEKLGLGPDGVWNEYGMTELSSQFYSRGVGAPHFSGRWVRGMVIDPANGREVAEGATGVLHLFDLANLWSVCAVQTRDLAVRSGENFVLIGRDPSALPRGCSLGAGTIPSPPPRHDR